MMTPNRYRKKPIEIEAVQLRWTTWNAVCDFLGDVLQAENPTGAREISAEEASDTCDEPGPTYIALDVRTTHGEIATIRHGDWIIPDSKPGTFYPCKPDVFSATYEPAGGGQHMTDTDQQAPDKPWWRRMSDTADSGQLPGSLIDTPLAERSTVWRGLLTEYVHGLAKAMDEREADLETHRQIAKRLRDGYLPVRSVYDATTGRWHKPGTDDTDDDPMTPEQFRAVWPEET